MDISSLILLGSGSPVFMYFVAKYYEAKELTASVKNTWKTEEVQANPCAKEAHVPALGD
jgi:hypothetical protein